MGYGRIYAKKVKYDGYTFDSEMECQYYKELKERQSNGEIGEIHVHKSFMLQKEFVNDNGRKHKAITYEPDFVFYDSTIENWRYVDVKGMVTEEFALKWKMFDLHIKNVFPHPYNKPRYLEVLKWSKTTGFVPIEDYKKIMKTKKQQLVAEKNYYKNIVLAQEHKREIAERKKQRELARLKELKELPKLNSAQKKRLEELKTKYD